MVWPVSLTIIITINLAITFWFFDLLLYSNENVIVLWGSQLFDSKTVTGIEWQTKIIEYVIPRWYLFLWWHYHWNDNKFPLPFHMMKQMKMVHLSSITKWGCLTFSLFIIIEPLDESFVRVSPKHGHNRYGREKKILRH